MCWPRLQRTSATFGRCPLGGRTGAWACVSASFVAPWLVTGFGDDGWRTGPTMGDGWIVE
eukprot:2149219-Pyramimonas_sp.AAC.1